MASIIQYKIQNYLAPIYPKVDNFTSVWLNKTTVRYFKKIAEFLLFSNIYLGTCITVLALPFTGGMPQYLLFHAFVFFATVSVYSILRVRAVSFVAADMLAYLRWAKENTTLANTVKYISIAATVVLSVFLTRKMQISIMSLGAVWVLYNLPIFSGHRIKFGLRYVWFLKPFIVGLIIAGLTTMVPLIDRAFAPIRIVYAVADIFCFASALVILFEVKDMKVDKPFNTNTIPIIMGVTWTRIIAGVLLLVSMGATLLFFGPGSTFLETLLVSPFILLILYLTFLFDEETSEYTYFIGSSRSLYCLFLYNAYLLADIRI